MPHIRPIKRLLPLLICLAVAGCAAAPQASIQSSPGSQSASEPQPPAPRPAAVGSGSFAVGGSDLLTEQQQALLLSFLDLYYNSLVLLEAQDPSALFAEDAYTQAAANRAVWQYVAGIRALQRTDLSLTGYRYTLTCEAAEQDEDGTLRVRVLEDNIQNFASCPGVNSEQFNVYHLFTLKDTAAGWRISQHVQFDSLYWMVVGMYARQPSASPESAGRYFASRVDSLLADAADYVALRTTQGQLPHAPQPDHTYDRAAAVSYALEWVGRRSDEWPDYSRYGGNCQNFVSQCLLAGGIPMDIQTPGIWKWYGSGPNDLPQQSGRSASWSSVESFLSYAEGNSGYGLVACVDAPYYSGQPGDILHLGTSDDWRHTILITEVLTDAGGSTVDYLICSNTADLKNFPASAYTYARQMLIAVAGWNE